MTNGINRRFFLAGSMAMLTSLAFHRKSIASDVPVKAKADLSDLSFLEGRVALHMRDDWTNLAPQLSVMKESAGFERITVHHTGDTVRSFADENSVRFALQNIQTDHCNRHFGDIGYHFVIDPEGKVWQARSMAYDGAHVSGQNANNVGVMILGNFESNQPSDGQISTMILMVNAMCEHFGIKKHRVFGHRDIGASLCPGRNLYEEVLKLKSVRQESVKEVARR